MPGPPKTPTALNIIRGFPGHHPRPQAEPKPEVIVPVRPDYLDDGAVKEWDHIVPILLRSRVLTEADGALLGARCQAVSRLQAFEKQFAEGGSQPTVAGSTGSEVINPLIRVIDAQVNQVYKLDQQFGLSPAARTKVSTINGQPTGDDWEERDRRMTSG